MYHCQCGDILKRVHGVTEEGLVTCKGFYCPKCKEFAQSIGREKKLPILEKAS